MFLRAGACTLRESKVTLTTPEKVSTWIQPNECRANTVMSSRTRPSSCRNTATKSSPIADSLIQVVSITVSSGGRDRHLMTTMVLLYEPPPGSIRAIEGIQEGRDLRLHRFARRLQIGRPHDRTHVTNAEFVWRTQPD